MPSTEIPLIELETKYFMNRRISQVFVLFIAATFAVSCGNNNDNDFGGGGNNAPTVEIVRSQIGSLPLEERLTGVVRAQNQTGIYPEIAGRITEVYVQNGERVESGQPLAKIRDDEFREQRNQAESDLDVAEAQVRQARASLSRIDSRLSRAEQLSERDMETQLELETLRADKEEAEANLDLAKAQKRRAESELKDSEYALNNTVIEAPYSGVVGGRDVEIGQRVDTGNRIFEIGDMDNMKVTVTLTEGMTGHIRPGHTSFITSPALTDTTIESQVTRISPFLNPVSHTTQAEIEVPNPGNSLRPGMFVSVDIMYGETDQATLVPNAAIFTNPAEGSRGVFVAEGIGTELDLESEEDADTEDEEGNPIFGPVPVEFVPVDIIAEGRAMTGISGLSEGQYVVTLGQNMLADRGSEEARVREADWDDILDKQQLESRDIHGIISDKLQRARESESDSLNE